MCIRERSMVASAIKSAMAELTPEDVTNRGKIEPLTQKKLEEVLNTKYGKDAITLYQVIIENMDFEDEYNAAIQQKSIAQQTASRQDIENKTAIKKAEADKTVEIKKAEAKAEKMRIEAEAQANANKELADSISDALILSLIHIFYSVRHLKMLCLTFRRGKCCYGKLVK